jgi:hypothetical protein
MTDWVAKATNDTLSAIGIDMTNKHAGSRYFCESLFWASQPKQAFVCGRELFLLQQYVLQ